MTLSGITVTLILCFIIPVLIPILMDDPLGFVPDQLVRNAEGVLIPILMDDPLGFLQSASFNPVRLVVS